MNYKNLLTAEIISDTCLQKLPAAKQADYIPVLDKPTHTVNAYNGDFMLYLVPSHDQNFRRMEGLNDNCGGGYDGF